MYTYIYIYGSKSIQSEHDDMNIPLSIFFKTYLHVYTYTVQKAYDENTIKYIFAFLFDFFWNINTYIGQKTYNESRLEFIFDLSFSFSLRYVHVNTYKQHKTTKDKRHIARAWRHTYLRFFITFFFRCIHVHIYAQHKACEESMNKWIFAYLQITISLELLKSCHKKNAFHKVHFMKCIFVSHIIIESFYIWLTYLTHTHTHTHTRAHTRTHTRTYTHTHTHIHVHAHAHAHAHAHTHTRTHSHTHTNTYACT